MQRLRENRMNYFTKEELEYLFRTFVLTNADMFENDLECKIQSMIENYCDHNSKFKGIVDTKDGFKDNCLICDLKK
jgi:hypothetical protein